MIRKFRTFQASNRVIRTLINNIYPRTIIISLSAITEAGFPTQRFVREWGRLRNVIITVVIIVIVIIIPWITKTCGRESAESFSPSSRGERRSRRRRRPYEETYGHGYERRWRSGQAEALTQLRVHFHSFHPVPTPHLTVSLSHNTHSLPVYIPRARAHRGRVFAN